MRRTILAILMALALVVIPAGSAFAANQDTVTITAKPGFISISNAPNSYTADPLLEGTDNATPTSYFTITNSSKNVNIDIKIKSNGWTSWTWGAPASMQGKLAASAGTGAFDIDIAAKDTDYPLCSNVTPATSPTWELKLLAPTAFTNGDTQTTTVTLTASKH